MRLNAPLSKLCLAQFFSLLMLAPVFSASVAPAAELPFSGFVTEGRAGGRWLEEKCYLPADCRALIGSVPQEAGAIARRTDAGNTGGSAEVWYGEIFLSAVGA